MSRGHVIIDGYNLLHAHPVHAGAAKDDIDGTRARLVADLSGFSQGGPRTIVVFDGAGNAASDGVPHHVGSLTVIFSPAGVSADATIEALAQRFRERGEQALVVTSDIATRETVRGGSVSVRSSEEFARELTAEAADRAELGRASRSLPLSLRIDPTVSEKLNRWARGH